MTPTRAVVHSNDPPAGEGDQDFLSHRSLLALTCLFWAYVTLNDVAGAEGMRIELSELSPTVMMFAPPAQRLLQHLLMLPILLQCYSVAARIGWSPATRRMPQQILLALAFSLPMAWAMMIAGLILQLLWGKPLSPLGIFTKGDWALWASSTAMGVLDYGCGLALIHGVATYRRLHRLQLRNAELRRDWAGARLAALRSQLSPHTLFNALHSIQARISREPQVAETLIASLGDLLRALLQAGERDFTLLRDELQFVELYLGLQTSRFADRLTVAIQSGDDVPTVWVPSLILQPLVENSVVHGLADHSGPVRIDVTWHLSTSGLQLRVLNSVGSGNGPGNGGLGLRNVRERLIVQFGQRAVMTAGPAVDGSSWLATVRLPVLREWQPGIVATDAVART